MAVMARAPQRNKQTALGSVRESIVTSRTSVPASPVSSVPRVALRISAMLRFMKCSDTPVAHGYPVMVCTQFQGLSGLFTIIKMTLSVGKLLSCFMALTGNQHHITAYSQPDGLPDRLSAIRHDTIAALPCAAFLRDVGPDKALCLQTRLNLSNNRLRLLAARIIRGHDNSWCSKKPRPDPYQDACCGHDHPRSRTPL